MLKVQCNTIKYLYGILNESKIFFFLIDYESNLEVMRHGLFTSIVQKREMSPVNILC